MSQILENPAAAARTLWKTNPKTTNFPNYATSPMCYRDTGTETTKTSENSTGASFSKWKIWTQSKISVAVYKVRTSHVPRALS
jgi:hypothetical protein